MKTLRTENLWPVPDSYTQNPGEGEEGKGNEYSLNSYYCNTIEFNSLHNPGVGEEYSYSYFTDS